MISKLLALLALLFAIPAFAGDSRVLHADQLELQNSGFTTTLQAGTLTGNTTYTLSPVTWIFPPDSGTANYVLRTDGAGNTTWVSTLSTLSAANSTTNGYLSSTDWVTFNNKQATISATAPITLGSNTVGITQAGTAGNGYLSSTDWNTFNGKAPSTRQIATTAPLQGGGDLSADRTLSITQAGTAANGYLSSTDWNTFNGKQQAITVGAIGSATTNGITLSAGTLALGAADGSNGGAITAGTQTLGGAKTWTGNQTLNFNLIFPITLDSTTTGSNVNLTHSTEVTRLSNASLTSIATLDVASSVSGSQATIINATGGRITLVNNYGSPPLNSAVILTATGADTTLPDKGTAQFTYSTTANAWYVTSINRGVQQIADGGTAATTKAAAFDNLQPMNTAGDTIYGGSGGTGTRLAAGTAHQLLHSGTTPSWGAADLASADVTGVLPTGNMAGPAATSTSGYLSSTDWNAFNAKQQAITVGAISGTSNTNGLTLSAGALNLTAADGTNGGAVTNTTQTFAGAKTFSSDLTFGANLTYSVTNNSTATGANANVSHPTSFIRLTNASLTSVATLDQGSNGHQVMLLNATGAAITLVNNYGTPPGGTDPIITGTGADFVLPNLGSATLVHSTSSGVWSVAGKATALATSSVTGLLSSADWTTFNNKVSTTRAINTTAPLQGGGDLSADRTLTITQSGTAANGYLSSTDWNTFNNKVNGTAGLNSSYLDYTEIATPATPGAGILRVYSKSGDGLYIKNSSGTESQLSTTAAATPTSAGVVSSYFPTIQSAVNVVSSADYTVTTTDGYEAILVSTGSVNRTVTLPAASSNKGRRLIVKKTDSGTGTVSVARAGSDTIDGLTSFVLLAQYDMVSLYSDGTATWNTLTPKIITAGTGADVTTNTQLAGTTTGTVRQFFKNSDSSRSFELDGIFTSAGEELLIQSESASLVSIPRNTSTGSYNGRIGFNNGYFGNSPFVYTFGNLTGITSITNFADGSVRNTGSAGVTKTFGNVAPCSAANTACFAVANAAATYLVTLEASTKFGGTVTSGSGSRLIITLSGSCTRLNASAFVGTADNKITWDNYNNNGDNGNFSTSFYMVCSSGNNNLGVAATVENILTASTTTAGLLVSILPI